MHKVSTIDLMDGNVPWGEPLWCDHVMFDIPETVVAAVRNAHPDFRAVTVHEHVALLYDKYMEFFEECERRDIAIVVAMAGSFERKPYEDYCRLSGHGGGVT